MKKYRIKLNPDKITPQELSNNMNFDEFANNIPSPSNWFSKVVNTAKWKIIAGVAGLIIAGCVLFNTLNFRKDSTGSVQPYINPPINNAGVKYSIFTIDGSRDTTIVYETGSTVHIPAHSFLDKDNQEVKDKVEIRYREYHDIYENILSGIPMEYDSANRDYTFESAGMLEFLPYKNGELLKINPKKPVVANMISYTDGDQFNSYYLDTASRKWEYLSKNTMENGGNVLLFDSTDEQGNELAYTSMKNAVYPVKANAARPNFTINYKKEEFPELALFDGVKFEIDPEEKTYNPNLSTKTWEDVSIQRKDGSHYSITFSQQKESHSFAVIPVLDGKDYEKSKKEFESKMFSYSSMMQKRKTKLEQQEEILKSNYEKYTGDAEWSNVNKRIIDYLKANPIRSNRIVMRTFEILRAGIHNFDKPWPFDSENSLSASIKLFDENNQPLAIKRIYMLLKSRNISRSNYETPKDNQIKNFRYNLTEDFTLLIITKDGRPAFVNSSEFLNSVNAKNYNIKMKLSERIIDNAADLKSFLNL